MTRDFYIRNNPDKHLGEGDPCLRDKATHRICAWGAGMEPETWQAMLAKGDVYASQGRWDAEKGMIV